MFPEDPLYQMRRTTRYWLDWPHLGNRPHRWYGELEDPAARASLGRHKVFQDHAMV